MIKLIYLLIIFTLVTGCAGYRFKDSSNPLAHYKISTVAVPYFLNQSTLPGVSASFTQEVVAMLSQFTDLRLKTGAGKKEEAVLLGIIDSPKNQVGTGGTLETTSHRLSSDVAGNSTQGRTGFFVPFTTTVRLNLRLVLIKRPSAEEIELLTSHLGKDIPSNPKILFNETLSLEEGFVRELSDQSSTSDAGVVNSTQNRGNMEKAIKRMASRAAQSFKELILYAF